MDSSDNSQEMAASIVAHLRAEPLGCLSGFMTQRGGERGATRTACPSGPAEGRYDRLATE